MRLRARLLLLAGFGLAGGAARAQDDADEDGGVIILIEDERAPEGPDPMRTSASVTVIEIDERLPASADLGAVVDSAAGTSVTTLGGLGDFTAVSLRGSSWRQVQVHLDGVPLNPDGASTVNLSELPLWAFQRVEIYRGNAPPELGASPIGGVIDLRSGDIKSGGVGVSALGGAFGTGRLTGVARLPMQIAGRPSDLLLVAEGFTTEGDYRYFSDNGTQYNRLDDAVLTRANNHKRQANLHARWRLGDRRTRLSLMEAGLVRQEGLANHANSPTEQVSLTTGRSLSTASLELSRGVVSTSSRAWGYVRRERFDDRAGEIGVGTQWNVERSASFGALAHAEWVPSPHVVPGLTVSIRQDRYQREDLLLQALSSASRRQVGRASLSGDVRLFSDTLTLSPVLQASWLDNRALAAEAFSDQDVPAENLVVYRRLDPRGGVLWRPHPSLAVKANAGRYMRPPDFTELFGDRGAVAGNPDLRPERGVQWDVGARALLPEAWPVAGSVELGHYWNAVDDLIAMRQNSQRVMVPVNLDRAWIQGLEAAATLEWWGRVETSSSLTWTRSVNLSQDPAWANKQLPQIPTWELSQSTALVWGERLRLGHTWSYIDGNYWDRTNWYRSTPRPVHGAFLRAQPGPRWPALELDVLNLADRVVEVVPANPLEPETSELVVQSITDFVGYPLPGRTLLISLRWDAPLQERRP